MGATAAAHGGAGLAEAAGGGGSGGACAAGTERLAYTRLDHEIRSAPPPYSNNLSLVMYPSVSRDGSHSSTG